MALDRLDEKGDFEIWLIELASGTMTRLTFDPQEDLYPIWSPDGKRIVFSSNRQGEFDLYEKRADGVGSEQLLLKSDADKQAEDWSPDGRFLLYSAQAPIPGGSLWLLPYAGDRKPVAFQKTEWAEGAGAFSPDGRWVAYTSAETDRNEIYVRAFPVTEGGGKWGDLA